MPGESFDRGKIDGCMSYEGPFIKTRGVVGTIVTIKNMEIRSCGFPGQSSAWGAIYHYNSNVPPIVNVNCATAAACNFMFNMLVIKNNFITFNNAAKGGSVSVFDAHTVIMDNNNFVLNMAAQGGAVVLHYAHANSWFCQIGGTFTGIQPQTGYWCPADPAIIPECTGVIGACSCCPKITNTKFHQNVATIMAGALLLTAKGWVSLSNVNFTENAATLNGGASVTQGGLL